MFVSVLDILTKSGTSVVAQIQANLASTGSNATGETSRTLRFEAINQGTDKQTLTVFGRAYFFSVETGRKATPQYTNPSYEFVAKIQAWMDAKGKVGSAFAVAKTIHQRGTKLYQEGGRKDIVSNVITPTFIEGIEQEILGRYAEQFLKNAVNVISSN